MKFLTDILARAGLVVEGVVSFNSVANATIDTDKFLTIDSGVVKYRTGVELLSDIGGQPLLTNPITGTGTAGQVAFYTGATAISGDSGLFWDNTNKRLGVGTVTPYTNIQVGSSSGAKYIGIVDTADSSYNIAYIGHNGTKLHIGFSNSNTSISERNAISVESSTLYVGLGVSAPVNRLQIGSLGSTGYSGNHFAFGNGTAATAFFQSNTSTQMYVSTYLALVGNMVVGGLTSGGYNLEVLGTFRVSSTVTFSTIANATTNTDRFIVSDSGVVKYRTAAQLLSDIGGLASSGVSGTTNYIPKFTSSSSIGNSLIYDGGSSIGINTSSPYDSTQFKLDVNGGFIVKNTSGVNAQFVMINSDPATGGNNAFFVQTVGGSTTTTWAQIQTYYGTSIAAGALRLQPAGGQILVGTTTASAFTVDINGTLRVSGQLTLSSTITNGTYTYTLPSATGTLALASDIPSLTGYVPTSRTLTINGTTFDLSANRSWTVTASYTETDTLATVTGRGATTSTQITLSGAGDNSTTYSSLRFAGYNQGGGVGYHGFFEVQNTYGSVTNGKKFFRMDGAGTLQIINSAYTSNIFNLTDAGDLTVTKIIKSGGTSSQYLMADGSVSSGPSLTGYVPTSRTLTINGTAYDLSADRSWTITAGVSSVSAGSGISVNSTTGAITVTNTGLLSATAGSGVSVSTTAGVLNIINTGILSSTAGSGISVSTASGVLNIVNTGLLSGTAGSGISVSTSSGTLNIVNTGLLSALAGSGISVSTASGTLTIVNTGLLSALAGAGISVSTASGTLTITNTITNNNQLTNGAGYITSYTETDTLATVTNRGNSTSQTLFVDQTTGGGYVFRTSSAWGGWARHAFSIADGSNNILSTIGGYGGSGTSIAFMYIGKSYTDFSAAFNPDGNVEFRYDNSTRLTIDSVGISVSGRTTSGWAQFSSSTQGTPIVKAIQEDTASGYYLFQGVTGSTEMFRVDRTGSGYFANKISVGTTYAGFAANINGTLYVIAGQIYVNDGYQIQNTSGNAIIQFNSSALAFTGAATFSSSITCTALTETSTIKVKENIVSIDSALDQVEKLQAVSYNRKGSSIKEIGLIAEAVEEVYPEFVQYDQNGEPVGLNYSRLTAVLIESVKELKKEIDLLKENRN